MSYEAYNLGELHRMYRGIKETINKNRRKRWRLIAEVEHIDEAISNNNKQKKWLKAEIKRRKKGLK